MASGSRGPEAAEAGFRVFLQDCSAAEPIAVSDLDGSMHWCQHALTQLCRHAGAKEICLRLSNGFSAYSNGTGVITTSTAFSGVGTPEVADEVIAATAATFLDNEWQDSWGERPQTPTFRCEFAVDKSTACQEELLVLPGGPKHVFENIAEFCPQEGRRMYGLVKGTPAETDNSKLEEALLVTHRPKLRAGCVACGMPCLLRRCDVHTAGSPCTDHSTLGLQAKFAGKNAKHFYLWASLCKLLQHRLIVHENVKAFGVLELSGAFGDMYFLAGPSVMSPPSGGPSIGSANIVSWCTGSGSFCTSWSIQPRSSCGTTNGLPRHSAFNLSSMSLFNASATTPGTSFYSPKTMCWRRTCSGLVRGKMSRSVGRKRQEMQQGWTSQTVPGLFSTRVSVSGMKITRNSALAVRLATLVLIPP